MQKNIEKLINILKALIVPALFLILWEVAANNGWIKVSIMSSPSRICTRMIQYIQIGRLQKNILISVKRVLLGYMIGSFCGILLGTVIGIFKGASRYLEFFTGILRPIPIIAWVPVLILWVGIGEITKIIVIAIGTFWPVFLNVMDGLRNVDPKYIEVATMFNKRKWPTIIHVIIPAAMPSVMTGLRIASGNALTGVVGAEMFAASSGIGYMVSFGREMNQADVMLGGVFIIGILGWALNQIVTGLGNKHG
jgi:sulfonate transport system permease protein